MESRAEDEWMTEEREKNRENGPREETRLERVPEGVEDNQPTNLKESTIRSKRDGGH